MSGLNLNNCSHAFRNIILNKKHNLDYSYGLNGDQSSWIEPGQHYEYNSGSINIPFLTDYHPKLIDYTNNLDVWGSTDGYSGNVRRGNYSNQWDKRGETINIADPFYQINNPNNDIREQWDDPIRNEYNSYLDYTNAIFLKDSDPKNILAGILTGDGIGLSLQGGSKISVVSDFDIQQTLAGRIYSTATGRDTRLGKIGMKSAAISMANNILRKTTKMTGGLVEEGISYLLSKITKGKIGDDEFEFAKYASPSITDAPGVVDNILSSTGIGGVINTAVGGLGIEELLSNNNWSKTATASNDGKYIEIKVDGVLVEYKDDTKPDFNKFISGNQQIIGREQISGQDTRTKKDDVYQNIWGSESEYRRLQQTELINWSGILSKEQIYQNLTRNKYQPGYTTNKKKGKTLNYNVYGTTENDPLQVGLGKNKGILEPINDVRITHKRQIYTWVENKDDITESNYDFDDAVYHGIDQTNLPNIDIEFTGDINQENTLLQKTRQLFKNGKINTMISSFYREDSPSEIQTAVSQYGISKGRNLINKSGDGGITPNLYKDPFCRVWTWERQYRNLQNTLRPFLTPNVEEDPGNMGAPIKLEDLHKKIEFTRPNLEVFAKFTSLQDNGLPKIAPYKSDFVTYDSTGKVKGGWKGEKSDRRKYNRNYFFSIENLAWKDLDLERILCPSQIGPNGGRIYWFSPLNLDFDETTSVSLNKESFIGRGEQVITYIDSIRTGNLSFTMVVDHSSFMEYMKYREFNNSDEDYQGILLWDAGCDDPIGIEFKNIYHGKNGNDDSNEFSQTELEPGESIEEITPPVPTKVEPEPGQRTTGKTETKLLTRVYYPNDYSGVDENSGTDAMNYIYNGGIKSVGYEMNSEFTLSGVNISNLSMMNGSYFIENIKCSQTDSYIVEKNMFSVFLPNITKTDLLYNPNRESKSNYLKSQSAFDNHVNQSPIPSKNDYLPRERYRSYMSYWDVENHHLNINKPPEADSISFKDFYDKCMSQDAELKKLLEDAKQVIITGNASSHGYGGDNVILAQNRADRVLDFIKETLGINTSDKEKWITKVDNANVSVGGSSCSSSRSAKEGRFAKVEIIKEITEEYIINQADIDKAEEEFKTEMDGYEKSKIVRENEIQINQNTSENQTNKRKVVLKGRYDEEMEFYNYVDQFTDLSFSNVKDKYNHYIPCFWSLTPEGFNGRLTFLNQCTRQGPTLSSTDKNSKNATNLSFGRPPVCVLKIGDFIQSRIYIESLSIDYKNNGQIQWDLNPEGIGIQPMMANIRISFVYTGGQDISGAIAQLQNAITFNYYANASVYDDRAATNGIDGEIPEILFNPDTYKNGNNYKEYLGVEQLERELMQPLETPNITQLTVQPANKPSNYDILKDMESRSINPMSVNNIISENNPLVVQPTIPSNDEILNNIIR